MTDLFRPRVLWVDDQPEVIAPYVQLLDREFQVDEARDADEALVQIRRNVHDVVLLDIRLGKGHNGLEVLRESMALRPDLPVLMVSAMSEREYIARALGLGAVDYLTKPVDRTLLAIQIREALRRAGLARERQVQLSGELRRHGVQALLGESEPMRRLRDTVQRFSGETRPVLVLGETGSGKELVARALHYGGARREGPFIPANVPAIQPGVLEAEVFGHVRGAYTGAETSRPGLFRAASGGTIFLDEIGEMAFELQAKLLRVLDTGMVRPVGADEELAVDVRVVAATNRDLEAEVRKGTFRQDLYYRLSTLCVQVPPLRERVKDIPLLVQHYAERFDLEHGRKPARSFSSSALELLAAQEWRGNVRELVSVVERALIWAQGEVVDVEALQFLSGGPREDSSGVVSSLFSLPLDEAGRVFERCYLLHQLQRFGGNVTQAANWMGCSRDLLYRRFHTLGIDPAEHRQEG